MEIEVGEYIRTTDGEIHKIKSIEGNFIEFENCYGISVREKDYILNHSKNIIDLIEVGDYVNGSEVVTVYGYDEDGNDKDDKGIIEVDDDFAYGVYLEDIKIISIVTKEQFKNIEYRLE